MARAYSWKLLAVFALALLSLPASSFCERQTAELQILEPAQGASISLFEGERAPLRLAIEFLTLNAGDCGLYKLNIHIPPQATSVVNPCVCVDTFAVCILTIMQPIHPTGNVTITVDITDPSNTVLTSTQTSIHVEGPRSGRSSCHCQTSYCGCLLRYADLYHRTLRCSVAGCDLATA